MEDTFRSNRYVGKLYYALRTGSKKEKHDVYECILRRRYLRTMLDIIKFCDEEQHKEMAANALKMFRFDVSDEYAFLEEEHIVQLLRHEGYDILPWKEYIASWPKLVQDKE